jgi:hypothetical protein
MSDSESDYAQSHYQQMDYQGSAPESDNEGQEGPDSGEAAAKLPGTVAGPSETLPEVSSAPVGMQGSSLHPDVLNVLQEKWAGWKNSHGSQRRKYWTSIVSEL